MVAGDWQSVSLHEKRTLAAKPPLPTEMKSLQAFPSRFESFFNDHFGFRGSLLYLHNSYKISVLHTSPVDEVIIGQDGWLFFNQNGMLDDFMGLDTNSMEKFIIILQALQNHVKICRNFGCRYMFVMAPNKQSVYPEYLPSFIRYAGGTTIADKLITLLRARPVAPFLDLRPALRDAKKITPIYFRTDTHWNERGAFFAYQRVIGKLREWYPDLPMVTENRLRIRSFSCNSGDLANMMGVKEFVAERTDSLEITGRVAKGDKQLEGYLRKYDSLYANPDSRPLAIYNPQGKLDIVLFGDSFSDSMIPFYAESFRRMVIFSEPFREDILKDLMSNGGFYPDLVLEGKIERNLSFLR